MEESKRRDFWVHGGSHTCVFSIDWERSQVNFFLKKNKKERMEESKRREFLCTWRFPYTTVLHRSGPALGQNILKKQEGKNGRKQKKRSLGTWRFRYSLMLKNSKSYGCSGASGNE